VSSTLSFRLALPRGYPVARTLQYLGRDPASLTMRAEGRSFALGLWIDGRPTAMRVELAHGEALAGVEARRSLPADAEARARDYLLRLLGLDRDPQPFERHVSASSALAPLIASRRGLRILQTPDPFDGLIWAIVGQQINLAFAFTLRRRLVERAGTRAPGGLFAPPTAEKVANLEIEELTKEQFSRRKAEYLVGAARRIVAGELNLARLAAAPAEEVEAELLAVRGLGPWSAHYLMMRAFGFEDCVPVGDSGLVRGLMKFFRLQERPGIAATRELMQPFAPYRSWATFHLWQSLRDEP
jgi:AraC family transcriptional regulator, regulatory protein of adaptative response / DNA-3-methyladenine glycosylase II